MNSLETTVIQAVNNGICSYCKFLSANDTGLTGGHQSGIYIHKNANNILFSTPGEKGENKDCWVTIEWQDGDFSTESRFVYYGKGTRNEYRITNFQRGFPYLREEHTGDLFVLVQIEENEYKAFILSTEEEMNNFLDAFSMSPTDTGTIIKSTGLISIEQKELVLFEKFLNQLKVDFPSSNLMSTKAREIFNILINKDLAIDNPDKAILGWTNKEYKLFSYIENKRYEPFISSGFESVEHFIKVANTVLNRRKSRAGHSLENHLAAVFDAHKITYSAQPKTEGHKKPDFIFPTIEEYHDISFTLEGLTFLAAKRTCKDRWRQILNEADRIPSKHLFTLQQGISPKQMDEMRREKVTLVVPKEYISTYPISHRDVIINLKQFLNLVKNRETKFYSLP